MMGFNDCSHVESPERQWRLWFLIEKLAFKGIDKVRQQHIKMQLKAVVNEASSEKLARRSLSSDKHRDWCY